MTKNPQVSAKRTGMFEAFSPGLEKIHMSVAVHTLGMDS